MSRSQRLRLGDVRAVFRLLGEMRDRRRSPAAMWGHAAQGARELVDADQASYVRFADMTPRGRVQVTGHAFCGELTKPRQAVWEHWSEQLADDLRVDLVIDAYCRRLGPKDAACHRLFDLIDRDEYQHSRYYQLWNGPYGVKDMMVSGHRTATPGECVGYSLHRLGRSRPFNRRERRILRLLIDEQQRLHNAGRLEGAALPKLTPRQSQILERMAKGAAPKAIAYELGLTTDTVRTYIKAIYRRFDVQGRDELMARLLESGGGLTTDDPPENNGA